MRLRTVSNWKSNLGMFVAVLDDEYARDLPEVVHVFTDAELRARDEQIIRGSIRWHIANPYTPHVDHNAIIAAAEADQ